MLRNEGVGEGATTTACFSTAAKNPVTTPPIHCIGSNCNVDGGKDGNDGLLAMAAQRGGFWAACKVYPLCGNSF